MNCSTITTHARNQFTDHSQCGIYGSINLFHTGAEKYPVTINKWEKE